MRQVLVAPQASALKAVVEGFMSGQPVAYILFGIGAMVTVVLEMLGLSSMVFAWELSPAATDHAHPRGRLRFAPGEQRADRPVVSTAAAYASARHRRRRTHGRRRAGRRVWRRLRLLPKYREELIQTPSIQRHIADNFRHPVRGSLSVIWFSSVRGKKVA